MGSAPQSRRECPVGVDSSAAVREHGGMLSSHGSSLSSRVILINGLLFGLGTAVLAFSPATVSSRPLWSEVIVLVVGLTVMIVANAVLVGSNLRPLDRLVGQLDRARSTEPIERLPVPT